MERYEAYKDSGVEWIGEIPDYWKVTKGSRALIVRYGYPFSSSKFSKREGWPLVRIRDVGTNKTETLYDGPFVESASVEAGDVLVGMDGDYKVARWKGPSALLNQRVCMLDNSAEVSKDYLIYLMPEALQHVNDLTYGTTVKHLGAKDLNSMSIVCPPRSEQQFIAKFLDAKTTEIDGLVADCEREVELLREYRKAVVSEAVTKGLDPNVPMKDSGIEWIGEIPERWGLPRLGMLLSGMKDGTHSTHERVEDGRPLLSAKNVRETCIVISDHESMITEEDYRAITACGYPAMGDVLLTTIGGSIGRAVVYTLTEVYAFQRSVMFLRPMKALLDSRFLCYMLRSNLMQRQMFERAAASAQDGIYSGDIARYKAILPPLHEQVSIADFLDAKTLEIDTLIEAKQQMAEKLREYRRSLISEAVTGKFKVPGVD